MSVEHFVELEGKKIDLTEVENLFDHTQYFCFYLLIDEGHWQIFRVDKKEDPATAKILDEFMEHYKLPRTPKEL